MSHDTQDQLRQHVAMIAFTALILSAAALARPDHGTAGVSADTGSENLARVQGTARTEA